MAQPSQSLSKFVKIIIYAIGITDSLISSIVNYGHIFTPPPPPPPPTSTAPYVV